MFLRAFECRAPQDFMPSSPECPEQWCLQRWDLSFMARAAEACLLRSCRPPDISEKNKRLRGSFSAHMTVWITCGKMKLFGRASSCKNVKHDGVINLSVAVALFFMIDCGTSAAHPQAKRSKQLPWKSWQARRRRSAYPPTQLNKFWNKVAQIAHTDSQI